jgi:hypothetical protein
MKTSLSVPTLLMRGMLVGFAAAALAFGFQSVFGEPSVDQAIAFEEQRSAASGAPAEPEVVSRQMQRTIGLGTALLIYGGALGGIFALVFATAYGRVGRLSARGTALLVALGGFVVVILVPFIKYPASPPAVGDPATIGQRTVLYLAMLLGSVVAALAAVRIRHMLLRRAGDWNATLVAVAAFIAIAALVQIILPPANGLPQGFSADTIWGFRLAALGGQLVLWTVLGLLFGDLTERSLRDSASTTEPTAAARAV